MADVIKKIRTPDGDLPIDYNALANLPELGELAAKDEVTKSDLSAELQAAVDNATTVTDFANGGTMNGDLTVNGELNVGTPKFSLGQPDLLGAGGGVVFDDHSLTLAGFGGVGIYSAGYINLSGSSTNIEGDVDISGNLTVSGESIESSLENVVTPQNTITLRDGTTTSLLSGEYTGIIAEKYDGTHNGMLVFDKDGTAYVGDEGDVQPLATRNLNNDNKVVKWDKDNSTLIEGNITIQDNGGIVINEGKALGQHSIAGGSTDKTVISDLLGSLATTQVSLEAPKALASNSISLGSGTVVNSVGGNAIGVWNTVGCKGYYWKELTNKAGAVTSTFALSATQPSLLSWEPVTSVDWQVGDTICVIDQAHFPFCATITAISTKEIGNVLTGKKTTTIITTTKLPFDGEATIVLTTPQNKSICAFYHKTEISAADNKRWLPRNGAVEMGWSATAFGVENLDTGSASLVTGWNNWQASNFGLTAGRENISGYSDITGGCFNKNIGENGLMVGKENTIEVDGDLCIVAGRNNTVYTGSDSTIVGGAGNENYTYNSLVVGARNDARGVDTGDHIIGGADNIIDAGWNSVVSGNNNTAKQFDNSIIIGANNITTRVKDSVIGGISNTITKTSTDSADTGAQANIIGGSYNNITNTKRSVIIGDANPVSEGGNNVIAGHTNTVTNSWNSFVGGDGNTFNGNHSILVGTGNNNNSSCNIVGGNGNTNSNISSIVSGAGNSNNGSQSLEIGEGNTNDWSGSNSIISGYHNYNNGWNSAISGYSNVNNGVNSVLSGSTNINNASQSIVGGKNNKDINGANNLIIGDDLSTTATTYNSVVGGARNKVGNNSEGGDHLVGGSDNIVTGWNNIVGGDHNTVSASNALVVGQYNRDEPDAKIVVGNGTKDKKSNAFTVTHDGDVNAIKSISAPVISGTSVIANKVITPNLELGKYSSITDSSISLAKYVPISTDSTDEFDAISNIISIKTIPDSDSPIYYTQLSIGRLNDLTVDTQNKQLKLGVTLNVNACNTIVTGARNDVGTSYINEAGATVTVNIGGDHIVGGADNTVVGGWNNIISGSNNTAIEGANNIVSGRDNKQTGLNSLLLGEKNIATANRSIVAGLENTNVNGVNNLVVGKNLSTSAKTYNTVIAGARNTVGSLDETGDGGDHLVAGADNVVSGWNNIVGGMCNTVTSSNTLVVGEYNRNSTNAKFMVGNGKSNTQRSNAFEVLSDKNGNCSIKIGNTELTEAQLKKLIALIKSV